MSCATAWDPSVLTSKRLPCTASHDMRSSQSDMTKPEAACLCRAALMNSDDKVPCATWQVFNVFVIFHLFITLMHLTLSRPSCQGRSRDHLSNLMCEEAIGTSAIAYFAASRHLWKYFQCCKVTYLQGEPLTSMFIYPRITTMKPALMQIRRFKDSEMRPAGPLAPPNMSIPLRSLQWYQGPLRSLRSTQTSELSISRVGPASCSQSFQRNS